MINKLIDLVIDQSEMDDFRIIEYVLYFKYIKNIYNKNKNIIHSTK